MDNRDFASAVVGHERRYCAMSADDPWARRRSIRMSEVSERVLLIDSRTGTTSPELWPPDARPTVQTAPATSTTGCRSSPPARAWASTPEGTTSQYRRDGVVFRPVRDAPPITVTMIWRRHDPHPATEAAVMLLTELYAAP